MDGNLGYVYDKMLERVKPALEKNNMAVYTVQTAAEVVPLLQTLVKEGCTAAAGGSMTLEACGVMAHLRSGRYDFWDRDAEGADRVEMMHKAFLADAYFASANAVTEQGEIYQVDGNANRVAAIAYGPKEVYLVVGRNKIVPTLADADSRRAHVAAPANARRVGSKTPCAVTGICSDCKSPDRICCTELVLRQQKHPGRIKVILVNEDLGY